jgi:hypothetical protein
MDRQQMDRQQMDRQQQEAVVRGAALDVNMPPAARGRTPPNGPFDARAWLAYFMANAVAQHPPLRWDAPLTFDARLCAPLARSLQRFQVGEQGDGLHLRSAAARTRDPAYAQAIELFVREEQGHSRLLAQVLARLGAPVLAHHWSDACFVFLRRRAGLRLEVLVLLVAELIAQHYYPTLRDGVVDDAALHAVFAQIAQDEEGHVAFHCAYLHSALAPLPWVARSAIRRGWRLLFRVTCLAVLLDHWGALRAVGETPSGFWRGCGRRFEHAVARIFTQDAETEGQTT